MSDISVNRPSIRAKLRAALSTPAGKKKIMEAGVNTKGLKTPEAAAEKFLEILQKTIRSSGLSSGVMDAVSDWKTSGVTYLGDGHYMTGVTFAGEEFRFSLDVQRYGGIENIVALYDQGVNHTMRPVRGEWHGKETWSRTVIPGAHFIDSAITEFMTSYASKYNVTGITKVGI